MGPGVIVGLKLIGGLAALAAVVYSYHWTYERGWTEGYADAQHLKRVAGEMAKRERAMRPFHWEYSSEGRLVAVDGQPTLSEVNYGYRQYERAAL